MLLTALALLAMILVLNINENIKIFYKRQGNYFEYKIQNKDVIYILNNSSNFYKKLSNDEKDLGYENYFFNSINCDIDSVAISQLQYETNFVSNKKYEYDILYKHRKVIANIYYPENQKGYYEFNITSSESNIINNLSGEIMTKTRNNFLRNSSQKPYAILINNKIINDYNFINKNLDCSTLIAFTNVILLKYIDMHDSKKILKNRNHKRKILSSEYVKRFNIDYPTAK